MVGVRVVWVVGRGPFQSVDGLLPVVLGCMRFRLQQAQIRVVPERARHGSNYLQGQFRVLVQEELDFFQGVLVGLLRHMFPSGFSFRSPSTYPPPSLSYDGATPGGSFPSHAWAK